MSDVKITQEHISGLLKAGKIVGSKFGLKTTVVQATLPNGFVITESSSCVDPANYNQDIGVDICMKRIEDRLWELEGYRLQCEKGPLTPEKPEIPKPEPTDAAPVS